MSDTGSSASARAIGLWRRTSFAVGDGPEDRTTTVFWGQTSRRYIDVRVPVRRPRCEPGDLACLADRDVRALGQQQGFAGDLVCVGDRFTWHRDIDFQPPTGRPDTGLVRIEGDTLHEEGSAAAAGSTYRETFRRIASGSRRRLALRSAAGEGHMSASAAPVRADLVLIDDHFLLARARPEALPAAPGLGSLLANARRDAPDRLLALLDCEIAKGQLQSNAGRWTIEVSTLPWREGTAAFALEGARLDGERLTCQSRAGTVRWTVVDSTLPASEIISLFSSG